MFEDHVRVVYYPERFKWKHEKEAVFDWLVDDNHNNYRFRHYLLENHFNQIGMACNCHINYGEFCVVELGLDVEPKIPEHEHPGIYNGYYAEVERTERYLREEVPPFSERLPEEWRDSKPNWWTASEADWAWLEENKYNFNKL